MVFYAQSTGTVISGRKENEREREGQRERVWGRGGKERGVGEKVKEFADVLRARRRAREGGWGWIPAGAKARGRPLLIPSPNPAATGAATGTRKKQQRPAPSFLPYTSLTMDLYCVYVGPCL